MLELTPDFPDQLKKQAGEQLRATWARMPRDELTPEVEQEIVEAVREVRTEQRKCTHS